MPLHLVGAVNSPKLLWQGAFMHEEGNLQRVNKHDIVNYIYIHITCINSVWKFFSHRCQKISYWKSLVITGQTWLVKEGVTFMKIWVKMSSSIWLLWWVHNSVSHRTSYISLPNSMISTRICYFTKLCMIEPRPVVCREQCSCRYPPYSKIAHLSLREGYFIASSCIKRVKFFFLFSLMTFAPQ